MLRAAVIEPQKENRELIVAGLSGLNLDIQSIAFSNIYDVLESIDEQASSFDIYFLNTTIHHEGDGIEMAARIRNMNSRCMICFITDSEKYYAEAFSVFATGYILYPFDAGELYNCITFYYQKSEKDRRASCMIKETGGNYRRIFTRYIRYVESVNRKIILHLEDGSEVTSYAKLDSMQEQLLETQFVRCHQSYIINMYFVEEHERSLFHIGDESIPISRKYQNQVKESYYQYMFENKI